MRKLERKGEVLAPLLVQARQSAQLGSLEQRFLLQTRSFDLISVPKKEPVFLSALSSLFHEVLSSTYGTL